MPRLKLELPKSFAFSTDLEIRITDVNYGQHLGNDALLGLLQEARLRFLKTNGFSEVDAGGAGMIMADAAVMYRAQAFHGDVLRIEVAAADPERCGCDLLYRVTRPGDGKEIARAKTGIVFFDYAAKKVVAMPEKFRAAYWAPG
jgi:acyl-CoA thioester hydrolase